MLYNTCSTMKNLEIKVKFYVEEIEALRKQLIDAGANSHSHMFENNICFDNTDDAILLMGPKDSF